MNQQSTLAFDAVDVLTDLVDLAPQFTPFIGAELAVAALILIAGDLVAVILRVEITRVLTEVARLPRHRPATLWWGCRRGRSHTERQHHCQT